MKAAAETFRPNPALDTEAVITQHGKGEALVSFLEGNGTPAIVERCLIRPPSARLGPITAEERQVIAADIGRLIFGKTGGTIGRAIVRGVLGGMLRR